jgi:xylulose-5-phosphate/fructose-6-phosphate phosphoketolase
MVMLNDLDRFRLAMDVIDRVPALGSNQAVLRQHLDDLRIQARAYTREHGEDSAEISGWSWPYAETGDDTISGADSREQE